MKHSVKHTNGQAEMNRMDKPMVIAGQDTADDKGISLCSKNINADASTNKEKNYLKARLILHTNIRNESHNKVRVAYPYIEHINICFVNAKVSVKPRSPFWAYKVSYEMTFRAGHKKIT